MSSPLATAPGPDVEPRQAAPQAASPTRPLYWSLRRELWENRSIHVAPLGVAVFAVVALVIHAIAMPSHMPGMLANDPGAPGSASVTYRVSAMLMLVAAFVTGMFYCLEALSGERRDRSILFWKSLPVSDLTTVAAKAIVPLVVLPLITFVAIVAMQLTLMVLSMVALLANGRSVAPLWNELHVFRMWGMLLYGVVAMTLWLAPVYAFLLLVSGWARRTAALWAVLPLVAAGLLEKLTMDTLHFATFVGYRLVGWYPQALVLRPGEHVMFHPLTPLTPGRFLTSPELWAGFAFAAVFLAVAVRMRRLQEPV